MKMWTYANQLRHEGMRQGNRIRFALPETQVVPRGCVTLSRQRQ